MKKKNLKYNFKKTAKYAALGGLGAYGGVASTGITSAIPIPIAAAIGAGIGLAFADELNAAHKFNRTKKIREVV